ncbi:MAG TPA: hypothetical protein ENJ50_05955, partial [Planctomycetaceae bacterium]|nr:hypothetical protein [Planctomycetaceae bacterium]
MSFFGKLFGSHRGENGPDVMPWDARPSIYDHIRAHVEPGKPGLTKGGESLPDEIRMNERSEIRWAPGAMDGVMSHHMGPGSNDESVRKAV